MKRCCGANLDVCHSRAALPPARSWKPLDLTSVSRSGSQLIATDQSYYRGSGYELAPATARRYRCCAAEIIESRTSRRTHGPDAISVSMGAWLTLGFASRCRRAFAHVEHAHSTGRSPVFFLPRCKDWPVSAWLDRRRAGTIRCIDLPYDAVREDLMKILPIVLDRDSRENRLIKTGRPAFGS